MSSGLAVEILGLVEEVIPGSRPGQIPQHQVIRFLGAGSYGRVSLIDMEGQLYALKEEDGFPGYFASASGIKEASILSQIKHPNLTKVIKTYIDDSASKISHILEYATQGNLQNWLSMGRPSPQAKLRVLYDIILGLGSLHDAGIIHADLKPANVLIHQDRAMIADYGLSQFSDMRIKNPRIQTVYWRAPEIFQGINDYDIKVDIWSLGILIRDIFAPGATLFYSQPEPRSTLDRRVYGNMQYWQERRITLPANTPYKDELEVMMNNCLQWNPDDRPSTRDLLELDLFAEFEFIEVSYLEPRLSPINMDPGLERRLDDRMRFLDLPDQLKPIALKIMRSISAFYPPTWPLLLTSLLFAMAMGWDLGYYEYDLERYTFDSGVSPDELIGTGVMMCRALNFGFYIY